jgi:hypothetical protein
MFLSESHRAFSAAAQLKERQQTSQDLKAALKKEGTRSRTVNIPSSTQKVTGNEKFQINRIC